MLRSILVAATVGAALLSGCGSDLPSASFIDKLRVLAVQAEPPEIAPGATTQLSALVLEPDILLFDEPDSGLDPVRTALLGELILEIHRDMMDEAKEKQKECGGGGAEEGHGAPEREENALQRPL